MATGFCFISQPVFSQVSSLLSGPKYLIDYDWTPPGLTNVIQLTDAEAVGGVGYLFTDKQVNNYVRLFIDHNKKDHFTADKSYVVTFQLKYWTHSVPFDPASPPLTASLTEVTVSPNPSLRVDYDYDNNTSFVDLNEYRFNNAYKIKITIISVKDAAGTDLAIGDLPDGLAFELGIERERYYEFDPTLETNGEEMEVHWDDEFNQVGINHFGMEGAIHYDVEWTYSNNYSATDLATKLIDSECEFAFHNNSTRIQVSSNSAIKIPAVFDRGYVIARVRGIGIDINDWDGGLDRILIGNWNILDNYDDGAEDKYLISEIDLPEGIPYVIIGDAGQPEHESDKNWMYQATYAEDGKMKHSITYMDGTMRGRQSVVLANTNKEVLITETFYDHQGRAAVQSLPAPAAILEGPKRDREIRYFENFNVNNSDEKFSKLDFDKDETGDECEPDLNIFGNTSGAGQYYSDQNDFTNDYNAFIPDAAGYPFVLTEFMPDMTGRVRRQTMPGLDHNLVDGHVTKYMYGTPFQEELDRLFGTNVGDASHYQKNAIIDPNGQVSVSYIDMKGNVIATALAGSGSPFFSTEMLVNDDTEIELYAEASKTYLIDLLDQDPLDEIGGKNFFTDDNMTLTSSIPIVVTEAADYEFIYTMVGIDYMEECLGSICLNCVYDLHIQLLDECKAVVGGVDYTVQIGDMPVSSTDEASLDCEDANDGTQTFSAISLEVGTYTITKTLSINQEAMEIYANIYAEKVEELAIGGCFTTLEQFETIFESEIAETDCDLDCDYCGELTTVGDFIAEHASVEDPTVEEEAALTDLFNKILEDCKTMCGLPANDFCSLGYNMMLEDVRPGGQYAEYLDPETGEMNTEIFKLSILNESTNLFPVRSIGVVSVNRTWRTPAKLVGVDWEFAYFNEDGSPSKIYIDEGATYPEAFTSYEDEFGVYVLPQELISVEDFISYYLINPSWAQSLVVYHPEWDYYANCSGLYEFTSDVLALGVDYNSFEFDAYLIDNAFAADTWDDLIHPEEEDPFFDAGFDAADMEDKLHLIFECETYEITAYQLAYLQTHVDPSLIYSWDCDDLNAYLVGTGFDTDEEFMVDDYATWLAFVGIYTGIKHDMWQEAANIDVDISKSYNGCIGADTYNYDYTYAESFDTEFTNFLNLLFGDYTCGLPTGAYLAEKTPRFPDPLNSFGFPLGDDEPEIDESIEAFYDESDLAYFESTGNPAKARDLEYFLDGWAESNLLTTDADILTNIELTHRLWEDLMDCGITPDVSYNWNPDESGSTLTWTPPGIGTLQLTLEIEAGAPTGMVFDDITDFYDIKVISETEFEIEATVDISGTVTNDVLLTGEVGSCINIGDYSFINSTCSLTPEANALWTIMNIKFDDDEFFSGGDVAESLYFVPQLEKYLGTATETELYQWDYVSSTEFKLTNQAGDRYITMHLATPISVDEFISSLSGISTDTYVGPNNNFTFLQETVTDAFFGYADWNWGESDVYDFPITDCGFEPPISCGEPEHFNKDDLESLLQKLVADGDLIPDGDVDLDALAEYTPRLELITGSPLTDEVWRVIEVNDDHFVAAISTVIDEEYFDNCTFEFIISDLEMIEAFEFDDAFITAINSITSDYAESLTTDFTYDFITQFSDGTSTYNIRTTSCIPIKNCNECDDALTPENSPGSFAELEIIIGSKNSGTGLRPITITGSHPGLSDDIVSFNLAAVSGDTHVEFTVNTDLVQLVFVYPLPLGTATYTENILGLFESNIVDLSGTPTYSALTNTHAVILDMGTIDPPLTVSALDDECVSNTIHIEEFDMINDCFDNLMLVARANALNAYNLQIEAIKNDFIANYKAECFNTLNNFSETFTMEYNAAEYQYTLYYYDQAGNLVATVPPEGVLVLPDEELDDVEIARAASTSYTFADPHELVSYYVYNSLNQLKWQKTPDAGVSEFWYDGLGRLVLSQNASQNETFTIDDAVLWSKFSYSKFDNLGRINEVGQITLVDAITGETDEEKDDFNELISDHVGFPEYLSPIDREEVIHTFYDAVPYPALAETPPFGADGQENLRKRIATVLYQDAYDDTWADYQHATHYTYDIHGNVFSLIQDNPSLESFGEQFKKIDYDYDLVSGNVNKVSYQEGDVDQFYHMYLYDADNRIEEVYSSDNGYYYSKEAEYQYYRHGPLARTVTGPLQVQGTDYAYTIQGWLKGVNAGAINSLRDMGKDGYIAGGNDNQYIAADAFGFILHYFDGDYAQIETGIPSFVPSYSGSDLDNASADLFNGNIKSMVTALRQTDGTEAPVLGKAYVYDQLNRLQESISFEAEDLHEIGLFSWAGREYTDKWGTAYTYDGNGNIKTMKRAGDDDSPYDMDEFEYHYVSDKNQLEYVSDNTALSGNYADDIDNQSSGNYIYDEIGNLIFDYNNGDELDITWNIYGKIRSINKNGVAYLDFAYDAMGNRIMKKLYGEEEDIYTYYIRDAQGNVMATYTRIDGETDVISLNEQHIYGSSRLGYREISIDMSTNLPTDNKYFRTLGEKRYEMVNHLGNVLAVITDRHKGIETTADDYSDQYLPDVIIAQDYDPFGMLLAGRFWEVGSGYRYGFNGKENTNEVYYFNNFQDYGFRSYDVRLGRFISVDPLTKNYPLWTPYQFAGNVPIKFVDLDGGEPKINGEKEGEYNIAPLDGTDKSYGWTWDQTNRSWSQGDLLQYSAGDAYKNKDHDLDKGEYPPDDRSKAVQGYIDSRYEGEVKAYLDFIYAYNEGTIFRQTKADDKLLNHFLSGDGSTASFGPKSDMSEIIGDVQEFADFANSYEEAAMKYFTANGTLNGFEGKSTIELYRPSYIGDPITSLFAKTVMGGYYQIDTKITAISSSDISVAYVIWDHFGAGIKDANSDLPGLAGLYYLQHYEGVMGVQYTPFIWNVTINR